MIRYCRSERCPIFAVPKSDLLMADPPHFGTWTKIVP